MKLKYTIDIQGENIVEALELVKRIKEEHRESDDALEITFTNLPKKKVTNAISIKINCAIPESTLSHFDENQHLFHQRLEKLFDAETFG